MKYQVTFYKNTLELITERKSNFVNKLKSLSSKITYEMMKQIDKKYDFRGTSGDKIVQFLLTMTKDDNRRKEELRFNFPISGKDIPIYINFECINKHLDEFHISTDGHCLFYGKYLHNITINVKFCLNEKTVPNAESIQSAIIDEFHRALVHELAHAHDEYMNAEFDDYKDGQKAQNEDLRHLNYWLKPTEIRSHFNEVFNVISSERHVKSKRVIKNYYKNADEVASREEDPVPFTQDIKNKMRTEYGKMRELDNSKPSYDLALKAMNKVISKSFKSKLPQSQRQFLIDYHVAFARDYNNKMKERYYDTLFKGYDVPSLDQMDEVFEVIKSIFRGITSIFKALKKKYYSDKPVWQDKWWKTEITFNEWKDAMWDNPKMSNAMKSNNPKELKKVSKETMELFQIEMGIDKETLAKDE